MSELEEVKGMLKQIKNAQDSLKTSIDARFIELGTSLGGKIDSLRNDIYQEISALSNKLQSVEERLEVLETNQPVVEYPVETSIIIINLRESASEDVKAKCTELIQKGLGLGSVTPVRATRLQSRNDKPGVIKVQLKTKADKIHVLRNKEQLKSSNHTKRVFIRSAQTHEERLMRMNIQTLINELPDGNQYRFTGNGRLIKKEQEQRQNERHNERHNAWHNERHNERHNGQQNEQQNEQQSEGETHQPGSPEPELSQNNGSPMETNNAG